MRSIAIASIFFILSSVASSATDKCISMEVIGLEYPTARQNLIAKGWQPHAFAPPFEGAPFAEWVKTRNFTEVEACAGTGMAPCKFAFIASIDEASVLNIFTQGEEVGTVTSFECLRIEE